MKRATAQISTVNLGLAPQALCLRLLSQAKKYHSIPTFEAKQYQHTRAADFEEESLIQPYRTQDSRKCVLIFLVLVGGTDSNHVEQLAILELRRYDVYDFRVPIGLVGIVEGD